MSGHLEEILHSAEAVWLSKDGHLMLYASFNDSLVKEVHSVKYLDNQYPTMRHLRYPKVNGHLLLEYHPKISK